MSHYVPDFEMDEYYSMPTSSSLTRPKKSSTMQDEDIMELLWQNGQVVMHSQNQRFQKKSPLSKFDDAVLPAEPSTAREIPSNHDQQLFMHEDEMASWLHYPKTDADFGHDFCNEFLYPPPTACVTSSTTTTATNVTPPPPRSHQTAISAIESPKPPIPPLRKPEAVQNFALFTNLRARRPLPQSVGPSSSRGVLRETTIVESNDTRQVASASRNSEAIAPIIGASSGGGTLAITSPGGGNREMTTTCEMTVTSSPGDSTASAEPPFKKPPIEDRKRKRREEESTECYSEDVDMESDTKKPAHGSTSTKRSRAAEVHNLSERRRRDRINEKMRALQELIPRCNKSDKASMLDEAIEYLKSLQLQVQMMSMGCSIVPMMFPGVQQYIPPMGMGMGMGMGMSMEMGMNRPMMPFPNMLAGSPMPPPPMAPQLDPRFPVPAFQMPPVQVGSQPDPSASGFMVQNPNQQRVPGFVDPFQQYFGLHQVQMPMPQNQTIAKPSASQPGPSLAEQNQDDHPAG